MGSIRDSQDRWSRIVIAVGEPVYVPKGLDAAGLERLQLDMEQRLRALFERRAALVCLWQGRLCQGHLSPINTIA